MNEQQISQLAQKVQDNRKYQSITPELVWRLAEDALRRGLTGKKAVKDVRNKLHQIGGAYFQKNPDYHELHQTLVELPHNLYAEEVQKFCREGMQSHASTAERIPILEDFYKTCLAPIAPVSSVLDLACGLNPLAIPWMPLTQDCFYYACDIYLDMIDFLNVFLRHIDIKGWAKPCDLTTDVPNQNTQVAFLLKSIPCLEQLDKSISTRLLQSIQADHILVSFPVRSLGGRRKGMPDFYRKRFYEILSEETWQVQEFQFKTELAFLVTK